jgi:hypothetical protein
VLLRSPVCAEILGNGAQQRKPYKGQGAHRKPKADTIALTWWSPLIETPCLAVSARRSGSRHRPGVAGLGNTQPMMHRGLPIRMAGRTSDIGPRQASGYVRSDVGCE